MFHTLRTVIGLGVVMVLMEVTTVSEAQTTCQGLVTTCLAGANATLLGSLAHMDYAGACVALDKAVACYNTAKGRSECAGTQAVKSLNDLNNTAEGFRNTYCTGGRADNCLILLKNCRDDFARDSKTTDLNRLCRVVDKARVCMDRLNCPSKLQFVLKSFENQLSDKVSQSKCLKTRANDTCSGRVAECFSPIEARMKAEMKSYDFISVCRNVKEAEACFLNVMNHGHCDMLKGELDKVNQKFRVYCTDNFTPRPCLETLQQCTQDYNSITNMALYKTDPLYKCEGSEMLVTCLKKVKADESTCPAVTSVKGIADYQHLQNEINQNCSRELTPCTKTAAECVVSTDLKMEKAEELGQFKKACTYAADFRKCLDSSKVLTDCPTNKFLAAERTYINDTLNAMCPGGRVRPCLTKVETCSKAMDDAVLKTTSASSLDIKGLCSAQSQFSDCLNKVNCPAVQKQLDKARTRAQQHECGATSITLSLTLLAASLLRLWL